MRHEVEQLGNFTHLLFNDIKIQSLYDALSKTGKVWLLQVTHMADVTVQSSIFLYFCIYHAYSIFILIKIYVKYFGACWQYHSYKAGIRIKA